MILALAKTFSGKIFSQERRFTVSSGDQRVWVGQRRVTESKQDKKRHREKVHYLEKFRK